jgi:ribonucleotide reductase alpha subunit
MATRYADYFPLFVKKGVQAELLDERLLQFDLARLGQALKADRDLQFDYLGLQTLYDRYFLHIDEARIELPQAFYMRVAMGLALNEIDREGPRDRVLRGPVDVRFHELDADPLQRRHPAVAAVELLPDDRLRRP